MNSAIGRDDNLKIIYCADDDENRIFFDICDELFIESYSKNHPKSGTHNNNKNIHRRQRLNSNT